VSDQTPSFIEGLTPSKEEVLYTIGPYQVLKNIGKGGMGEVLLAYDTKYGRRIAIKKIRGDLKEHKQIHNRFLKEAIITCQLTHPAIIPIYVIEGDDSEIYYTMPFIQGETLKTILRKTRQQEKEGKSQDHLGGSIPALIRVLITVCQAVAYAHSKGVLHRDLKPENIMIGKYGEVHILDWGLAELIDSKDEPQEKKVARHKMTNLGKVVGTLSYMAPERALGQPATIQTDIYSLGVILYQLLTLRNPFRRGTLKDFRRRLEKEVLYDPQEVAPYRDIPPVLSRIVLKCLERSPKDRYSSVDQLIHELENYIEGRSEWFPIQELDIQNGQDWEFQEHVLIAEHVAITRATELSDWVNLMISKTSFSENTRLEATVRIGEEGNGIGFLLSVPEPAERNHINDGFCLWIGSDLNKSTKLFKSTVEMVSAREVFLTRGEWVKVRIEKIENNLYFYLNNALQFSYISHLPLTGTHVGLMARDADFAIEDLIVSVASMNLTVRCLAVPDSLLAHKLFSAALAEYRRIGYSFPGRKEGRDALFRAGITLLEQGKGTKDLKERNHFFEMALEEFEKLHDTPGAPLEYLGKSLVYSCMAEEEEEYKCLELAFRRYRHNPLLYLLEEHIAFRLHESSRVNRKATYHFVLIILRHTPNLIDAGHVQKLFSHLKKHWEKLPFISTAPPEFEFAHFALQIAFWLAKPQIILEIIEEAKDFPSVVEDGLFCLLELGLWKLVENKMDPTSELYPALICHLESVGTAAPLFLKSLPSKPSVKQEQVARHLIRSALDLNEPNIALEIAEAFPESREIIYLKIWALIVLKKWESASHLFQKFSFEDLTDERSLLFTLYGCFLAATEGKDLAEAHFGGLLERIYPPSGALLGYFVSQKLGTLWESRSFHWERRSLWRELSLFYAALGNESQSLYYLDLARHEELS
jgi:serine/threonine-protein kinase